MILTNSFTIEAPITKVWALFDALEQVVPCMPGASYLGKEVDDHRVSLKLKIGAISSDFKGTVRFLQKDDVSHTVVIRGAAKDAGGKGSASATIEAKLRALAPERTSVSVQTEMALTGRLVQFGGPIVMDIAERLISEFSANLHRAVLGHQAGAQGTKDTVDKAAAEGTPGSSPAAASIAVRNAGQSKDVPALDLGPVVGDIFVKYALKYLAVAVAFFFLGWLVGKYL